MAAVATIRRDPVLRPVAAALFALGAGIGSYAPYQSLIATGGLGIGNRAYAAVLVIASLVAAGGAVSIGILSDRRGNRRRLAAASAVSWLAGPVLMTFYPSQASFVLAHALFIPLGGTLFGQFFVLARIAAARHPAAERAGIQASIRAAFAAPFILILPLWSVAIRAGAPLLAVYPVLGLAGVAVLCLVLRHWPPDEDDSRREASGVPFGAALAEMAHPGILLRLMAVGLLKAGPALYMVLIGLVLTGAGRSQGDVALFAGLVAGGEIPVMLATGWLLGRIRRTTLIALAALVYAVFLAGFTFAAGSPLLWVFVIPAAAGAGIILSVPLGYLQDLIAHRPGAGGSLIALHQFAGDATAAAAFAAGTSAGGLSGAALAGAAIVAAGGGTLWLIGRGNQAVPGRP